jgi:hypothetical protein
MVLCTSDLQWLNTHAEKQGEGSYKCIYIGAVIEFVKSDIEIDLPFGIKQKIKVIRPVCPGCNPGKKLQQPAEPVTNKNLNAVPKIP